MKIKSEPGRFFIADKDGTTLAEIKYLCRQNGKILDIVHTFVVKRFRNQGIAHLLLERVILLAEEKNAKIIPTCKYAKLAFRANPKYQTLQYNPPKEDDTLVNSELIDQEKKIAGERGAKFVEDKMTVGLGTGSTVFYLVKALAARIKEEKLKITAVATSNRTATLAKELGITIKSLSEVKHLDLTIDGADEVDFAFQGIKGGGAALTFEKIVAVNTTTNIWIVDNSKMVKRIGAFPLPLEVIPFGCDQLIERLENEGLHPKLRVDEYKNPILTDSKNYLVDLHLKEIIHPHLLADWLDHQVGIVEHGLFLDIVDKVIVGKSKKTEVIPAIR